MSKGKGVDFVGIREDDEEDDFSIINSCTIVFGN